MNEIISCLLIVITLIVVGLKEEIKPHNLQLSTTTDYSLFGYRKAHNNWLQMNGTSTTHE